MTTEAALRGYLLEEALAWLLRRGGYELLLDESDDPVDLRWSGQGLTVRGRGADHPADMLGELAFVAPLSLPVRLFVEARFRSAVTGLPEVRNAHGVVADVNDSVGSASGTGRAHRRHRYAYALFSTSGFSSGAQHYALAHEISLVDLSGPAFEWLRAPVQRAAAAVVELASHVKQEFPSAHPLPQAVLRHHVRLALEMTDRQPPATGGDAVWDPVGEYVTEIAWRMRQRLARGGDDELLLGFPPAPFPLALTARRPGGTDAFVAYARRNPTHPVWLLHKGGRRAVSWEVVPADGSEAYRLCFNLPGHLDSWLAGSDQGRAGDDDPLSSMLIHRVSKQGTEVFRLQYSPRQRDRTRP
ncbi:hypothetical protein [Luedemannella helvata]